MFLLPTLVYHYKTNKQTNKGLSCSQSRRKKSEEKERGKSTYIEQTYTECQEFNSLWNQDFRSSSK